MEQQEKRKKNEIERWMRDYFTTPFGIVETTMCHARLRVF